MYVSFLSSLYFSDQLHASSFPNQPPSNKMSLWAKVRELEGDALRQIQSLYGPNFPIQFRHYFADIIERQMWYEFSYFISNITLFDSLSDYLYMLCS